MLIATFHLDKVKFTPRPRLVHLFLIILQVVNLVFSFALEVWLWQIDKQITRKNRGGQDAIPLYLLRQISPQPGGLLRCAEVVDLNVAVLWEHRCVEE